MASKVTQDPGPWVQREEKSGDIVLLAEAGKRHPLTKLALLNPTEAI